MKIKKTKSVLDYAKSSYNGDVKQMLDNTFILETDEGTKSSEVKGKVDLEQLTTKNKYVLNSPITKSEYVVINEVDKGSSVIRNSLLGIMNEKILFNGDSKVPCNWKLFIATCNTIPKDELDNPFWDRFLIKYTVDRLTASQMMKYFSEGGKNYQNTINLRMPEASDIDAMIIPNDKLELFIQYTRNTLSDRTLSFVPTITKAVSLIWNISIDKALVKTAQLLADDKTSRSLAQALIPKEMKEVIDKMDMLEGNIDDAHAASIIDDVNKLINTHVQNNVFTESQIEELKFLVNEKMDALEESANETEITTADMKSELPF